MCQRERACAQTVCVRVCAHASVTLLCNVLGVLGVRAVHVCVLSVCACCACCVCVCVLCVRASSYARMPACLPAGQIRKQKNRKQKTASRKQKTGPNQATGWGNVSSEHHVCKQYACVGACVHSCVTYQVVKPCSRK